MSLGAANALITPVVRIVTANSAVIDETWCWRLCDLTWRFYVNGDEGATVVMDDGSSVPLPARNAVIIPPETPCQGQASGEIRHLFVHFQVLGGEDRLKELLGRRPLILGTDPLWEDLLDLAFPLRAEEQPTAVFRILAAIHHALALACRRSPGRHAAAQQPANENPFLVLARWIKIHADESIRVTELADRMRMGRSHFTRRFIEEFGIPPSRYILECRIRHAAGLLAANRMDIVEVAKSCGFSDRYHFSRVFKKVMGESPAAFKRKHAFHL